MKNILIALSLVFALSITTQAQDQYTSGMQKALGLWGEQKSDEAVAMFERIAQAETKNWIPSYYAANVLIVQSFSTKEVEAKNGLLEKAKKHIAEAHNRSENNSEVLTLEGMLYTAYVAMDPGTYGMQYSGKIMALHEQAIAINPDNPRALANKIEYEMGSARFFNQDLAPLCEKLNKVLPKFDEEKSMEAFAPSGGKERVQQIVDNCGK